MRDKTVVYIASPYVGDVEANVRNAARYCRFAADAGAAPIAPHLFLPLFMSEETERDAAMRVNMAFLERCDQLWAFGGKATPGMAAEIARAEELGKPVRYFADDCTEVSAWAR